MSSHRSRRWGPIRSLLALAPVFIGAPLYGLHQHFALPEPLTDLTNTLTSLPQLSESQILGYAKHLSEGIGYRTVGTREHALADVWMLEQAEALKKECERAVEREVGRKLECEVWRQQGNGTHRFDMMGKRLYKVYKDITNIVVRISDGTPASKEHAVLVNAHLDSTLPSPGAADDALSVGVMLECMRVLVGTPGWSPTWSIVFLFNHAEESLQDGSHLFSTQHEIRHTIRAAINLEAAGTTGRDLLFQATSEQMIQAYSEVPRPFGTIMANDIFSSGIILSDTDFRQFEQYLNVTGLDIAVVGNSYLYHMRKDLVEYIQPGVAQHMASNALALLQHLSSSASPISELTSGYTPPSTVFFSHLGIFWIYSFNIAKAMYATLFVQSLVFIFSGGKVKDVLKELARGATRVLAGLVGAVVGVNVVAAIMDKILGKGMSWFSNVHSPVILYAPPALFGALTVQLLLPPISERSMFSSILLLQSLGALSLQMIGIGSAAIFYLSALPLFLAMGINEYLVPGIAKEAVKVPKTGHGSDVTDAGGPTEQGDISLWTYALGQATPLMVGTQILIGVCEFFVPLTGRIGAVPADHIIATIISVIGASMLPLSLPFAHRYGRRVLSRAVGLLGVATLIGMVAFSMRHPFDAMHQKRVFVIHAENVTTHERHLHLADADGAPGFKELVADIAEEFGLAGTKALPVVMDDYNADWDSLYPFSSFLSPYKIQLPKIEGYVSPFTKLFTVTAEHDVVDEVAGTRSLTLKIYHPGLIWTVVAFDAHVLKWTLDDSPPDEFARHHIKEASFYGTDTWTVDLVIQHSPSLPDLTVNYIGIQEKGMWPAKIREKDTAGGHQLAMGLFEEFDEWLDKKTGGSVDALLLGCVGGATVV